MKYPLMLLVPLSLGAAMGADLAVASAGSATEAATVIGTPGALCTLDADCTPDGALTFASFEPDAVLASEVQQGPWIERVVPPDPALAEDPPGEDQTPAPTAAEWRSAPAVALARRAAGCRSQRVREWVQISCPVQGDPAAVDLLAGPREGVSFELGAERGSRQAVVFPVRRGDRRVFEVVRVSSWSKYSLEYDVGFVISEEWLAGAEAPTVVVD